MFSEVSNYLNLVDSSTVSIYWQAAK